MRADGSENDSEKKPGCFNLASIMAVKQYAEGLAEKSAALEKKEFLEKFSLARRAYLSPLEKAMSSGLLPIKAQAANIERFNALEIDKLNAQMLTVLAQRDRAAAAIVNGVVTAGWLEADESKSRFLFNWQDSFGHSFAAEGLEFAELVYPYSLDKGMRQVIAQYALLSGSVAFSSGLSASQIFYSFDNKKDANGNGFDPLELVKNYQSLAEGLKESAQRGTRNNPILLIGGTAYSVTHDYASINAAVEILQNRIASDCGVPMQALFELKDTGALGTDSPSFRRWIEKVKAIQDASLYPYYKKLLEICGMGGMHFQIPSAFALSEAEKLAMLEKANDMIVSQLGMGIITAAEAKAAFEEYKEKIYY